MFSALAVCLGIILPLPALGEPQEADTSARYTIEEIVVSATRTETNVNDVSRSVSVAGMDQLSYAQFNNPATVLSTLPGISLIGEGQNPGAVQSLYMRGANPNQTMIMVDGLRLSDPSTPDEAFDLSELSLANVERIEVVRGSHSSLYGSSAIGGVVNFITADNQPEGLHVHTDWHAGVFGPKTSSLSEKILLDYANDGISFRAGLLNSTVHGVDATIDTVTNPAAFQRRDRDNSSGRDWIARIGYQGAGLDFTASFRNSSKDFDLDKGAYVDDNNYLGHSRFNMLNAHLGFRFNPSLRAEYIGGLTDSYRQYVNDSSVIDIAGNTDGTFTRDTYRSGLWSHELQLNVDARDVSLVSGLGISGESMNAQNFLYYRMAPSPFVLLTDLGPLGLHSTLSDIFLHANLSGRLLADELKAFGATIGVRTNWHSQYGSNVTFEAGPSFHPSEETMLFASYSTGFNAPSLYQLYAPTQDFTSGITRGNSRLQPEESRSFEIGLRQVFDRAITFGLSIYRTIVDHEVEYVYLWNPSVPVNSLGFADARGDTYLNVGTQTNDGIEVSLSGRVTEDLSLSTNLSIVRGTLNYSPSGIDLVKTQGNQVQLYNSGAFLNHDYEVSGLVRRPSTFNFRCSYRLDPLTLQLIYRYVGSRNDVFYDVTRGPNGALGTIGIANYSRTDCSVRYVITSSIAATLFVENLFDVRYSEIAGYTTRGRGLYLQLQAGW